MNHQLNAIAAGIESFNGNDPAQVEQYSKLLDAEYDKYDKINAIGAGIEESGKVCLKDIAALEELYPGLMDASGQSGYEFTLRPSEQGVVAALEAINWAKVGRWALITWLILLILNIIGAITHANSVDLANARIREYNESLRRQQQARDDASQSWQRANSSSGGGDWFKDFEEKMKKERADFDEKMRKRREERASQSSSSSSSSSSSNGSSRSSFNDDWEKQKAEQNARQKQREEDARKRQQDQAYKNTGGNASDRAKAGAEEAASRKTSDMDHKARANVELMKEFETLTARLLRTSPIGFSSSQLYLSKKWTIEYVIRNKVEYHMIVGPDGYFDYKETFYYGEKGMADTITGRIKDQGKRAMEQMAKFTPVMELLTKIDQRVTDTFKQVNLLVSGAKLTDSQLEPMINRLNTTVTEVTHEVADVTKKLTATEGWSGPLHEQNIKNLIRDIWPTEHEDKMNWRRLRMNRHEPQVDPASVNKLFDDLNVEISNLATISATMEKLHKAAKNHKEGVVPDLAIGVLKAIADHADISSEVKHTLKSKVSELNTLKESITTQVIKAYKHYQQEIAGYGQVIHRTQEATKIVSAQLRHEEMFEKQIKKVYDMAAAVSK